MNRATTHGYSAASRRGDTGSAPAHTGCVVDLMEMRHIFLGILQFSTYNIFQLQSMLFHSSITDAVSSLQLTPSLSDALKTRA